VTKGSEALGLSRPSASIEGRLIGNGRSWRKAVVHYEKNASSDARLKSIGKGRESVRNKADDGLEIPLG
jgi:hypothetical protein